ncbi:MAG: hypothetical protein IPF92_29955 [Myxococcales bacterium]|nr:hypothetical protein [Myxococcales bacterium]
MRFSWRIHRDLSCATLKTALRDGFGRNAYTTSLARVAALGEHRGLVAQPRHEGALLREAPPVSDAAGGSPPEDVW